MIPTTSGKEGLHRGALPGSPAIKQAGLRLTPSGHLVFEPENLAIEPAAAARLAQAFTHGSGPGLLQLSAAEVATDLPLALGWWRSFGQRYITVLRLQTTEQAYIVKSNSQPSVPSPDEAELTTLVLTAPIMPGAEFLTQDILRTLWSEIDRALIEELETRQIDLQSYLHALNPAWNLLGRVHFNLAENKGDPEAPFAFITLQAALNGAAEPRVERFGWTYAPGDKVKQIENDYDREIYNGDIGFIARVDAEAGEIAVGFDGREVVYGLGELDALMP